MKAIIIFYSLEGNTESVAQKLKEKLNADLLQLVPEHEYPSSGAAKYLVGGKAAVFGEKPALKPFHVDLADYDTVLVGTPVWASTFAPPLRTFFVDHDIRGKKVGFFACQAGNGAEKCFDKMKQLTGVGEIQAELILNDPKTKPTDENETKIAEFCAKIQ